MLQLTEISRNDVAAARQWVREQLETKGEIHPDLGEVVYMLFDDFSIVAQIMREEHERAGVPIQE